MNKCEICQSPINLNLYPSFCSTKCRNKIINRNWYRNRRIKAVSESIVFISDLPKEEWKPVVGYEGSYEVSNMGRVKSLTRTISYPSGIVKTHTGILIKQQINRTGYCFCLLSNMTVKKMKQIHVLVASAFLEKKDGQNQVNHLNAVRTDNRLANLEWSSPKENTRHAINMGLMNVAKGEMKPNAKFTDEQVREIKIRLSKGEIGYRIAKEFKVRKAVIAAIRRGNTWKHIKI